MTTATQKEPWSSLCVLLHMHQSHLSQRAQPLTRTKVENCNPFDTLGMTGLAQALTAASIFRDNLL